MTLTRTKSPFSIHRRVMHFASLVVLIFQVAPLNAATIEVGDVYVRAFEHNGTLISEQIRTAAPNVTDLTASINVSKPTSPNPGLTTAFVRASATVDSAPGSLIYRGRFENELRLTSNANYGNWGVQAYAEASVSTCLGGEITLGSVQYGGFAGPSGAVGGYVRPDGTHRLSLQAGGLWSLGERTGAQTVVGGTNILEWSFVEEDPWSILRNTTPLVTTGIGGPSVIEASFSPKNSHGDPIRLECLANALGFDHFNWKQTWKVISNSPVEIQKVAVDLGDASQPFKAVGAGSNPMIDPATDFPLRRIITKTNDGRSMLVLQHGGGLNYTLPNGTQLKDLSGAPPDSKPLYYNESGVDNMQWKDRGYINNGYSAYFYDAPTFDAGWASVGDYFFFETELQGVDKNGNGTPLGVGFTWRTEAKFGTGSVVPVSYHSGYLQVLDRSGLPLVTEGGVELIEIFNKVPEPSILYLLSFLAAGISRRHIRVAVEGR